MVMTGSRASIPLNGSTSSVNAYRTMVVAPGLTETRRRTVTALRLVRRIALSLRHLVLDDPNDDHQNCAPNSATADIGEHTLHIQPSATRCGGAHDRLQDGTAKSAAN